MKATDCDFLDPAKIFNSMINSFSLNLHDRAPPNTNIFYSYSPKVMIFSFY